MTPNRAGAVNRAVLVEPFAGLAALSHSLFWLLPPCSRLGSKAAYAGAIAKALKLQPLPERVILADVDAGLVRAMKALFHRPQQLALQVSKLATRGRDARRCWDMAKEERNENPAAWWLWAAGAWRGVGRYRGEHIHRPNLDGFSPNRDELVRRIASRPILRQVSILRCSAAEVEPFKNATVYLDPPFAGRDRVQYESGVEPFDLEGIARSWVEAGSVVAVSEAKPLRWRGFRSQEITGERRGAKSALREWLAVSAPTIRRRAS
jgi:hypothetical protein